VLDGYDPIELIIKKHASSHHPARRPLDGFWLESLQANYSFSTAKNDLFLGVNRVAVTNVLFQPDVNALT
jgi:hypothetical protein